MEASDAKISFTQLFMILALMNGLASHVIVNPMVLDVSGRDSWITALMTGAVLIVWLLLLYGHMQMTRQQNWQKWLSRRTHPVVSLLLTLPVCAIMFLIGGMTVVHTATWHVTNYLPSTSKFLMIVALVVLCSILSLWGIRVIAVVAGILLPIVVGLGMFVSYFNAPSKDYMLLQPVLEHGWHPIWQGMIYIGAGYAELIVLIALQHHLKSKIKLWQLLLFGVFSIIISMGPLIGAITEFGPEEAAHQLTSPYEQWRLVQIGQFIEHLDFLSIFQWLSGASMRISLSVYLFVELMPFKKARQRYWAILIVMCSYLVLSMLPTNENSFYNWMFVYYMPISLIVLVSSALIWAVIALLNKSSEKEVAHE